MVDHLVSEGPEVIDQLVAELQTGVVGGDVQDRQLCHALHGSDAGQPVTCPTHLRRPASSVLPWRTDGACPAGAPRAVPTLISDRVTHAAVLVRDGSTPEPRADQKE
ncbi:hypothetical protein GCM10022230_10190 [Pseudoclavibacter caeni]